MVGVVTIYDQADFFGGQGMNSIAYFDDQIPDTQ